MEKYWLERFTFMSGPLAMALIFVFTMAIGVPIIFSAGIATVNIDNGFGAGVLAHNINLLGETSSNQ